MSIRTKLLAAAATATLLSGVGVVAAGAADAAPALTVTCVSCVHVQSDYAFRGALDAVGQATAPNSPISLWYETPTTTDSGADLQVTGITSVVKSTTHSNDGVVNQSSLNWFSYVGDTVVRFKYDPFGNGGANTYIGLNGLKVALRADNPNSIWQEDIEVPVTKDGVPNGYGPEHLGGVKNACGDPAFPSSHAEYCVLVNVGQTANPNDPFVITDPGDANTGSLVQQVVTNANQNQFGAYPTNQVWDFQN